MSNYVLDNRKVYVTLVFLNELATRKDYTSCIERLVSLGWIIVHYDHEGTPDEYMVLVKDEIGEHNG